MVLSAEPKGNPAMGASTAKGVGGSAGSTEGRREGGGGGYFGRGQIKNKSQIFSKAQMRKHRDCVG